MDKWNFKKKVDDSGGDLDNPRGSLLQLCLKEDQKGETENKEEVFTVLSKDNCSVTMVTGSHQNLF